MKNEGVKKFGNKLESDIFNQKQAPLPKTRVNPSNKSNVFAPMRNEDQFSKEIKDYTKERRIPKTEYDPTPYYTKLNAAQQKVCFVYGDHQFL